MAAGDAELRACLTTRVVNDRILHTLTPPGGVARALLGVPYVIRVDGSWRLRLRANDGLHWELTFVASAESPQKMEVRSKCLSPLHDMLAAKDWWTVSVEVVQDLTRNVSGEGQPGSSYVVITNGELTYRHAGDGCWKPILSEPVEPSERTISWDDELYRKPTPVRPAPKVEDLETWVFPEKEKRLRDQQVMGLVNSYIQRGQQRWW